MANAKKVDGLITAVPGQWKFDEQVAAGFDDHVRKSIPLYDELQSMVVDMSEWFISDGSTIYDLGSSTGETISLLQEKHSGKEGVRYIGIESSSSMISSAREKCRPENARFVNRNVMEMKKFDDADLVLSLYTAQFLALKDREVLLSRIYESLSEGGVLVMAEKIQAENPQMEDMWLGLHWDFKKKQGLTDEMILQKERSLRGVMIPVTLSRNIELLENAGFTDIDVFLKWHNFAGLIAFKAGGSRKTFSALRKRTAGKRSLR